MKSGNYMKFFVLFQKNFNTATKALSDTYYPTCNLIFYNRNEIAQVFSAYRDDDSLEEAIHDMEEKFRKYFENIVGPKAYHSSFDDDQLMQLQY